MSTLASTSEIDRLEAPSPALFEREYVNRNRPVIITGITDRWRAMSAWTPDYLRSLAGDAVVETSYNEDSDHGKGPSIARETAARTSWLEMFRDVHPVAGFRQNIRFGELLDRLLADPPDTRFFLSVCPLRSVSPQLLDDLDSTPYIESKHCNFVIFTGRDAYTVNHYHGAEEAFCCPIVGAKRVTLYAPDQTRHIYPYPWHTPMLNLSQVDDRHPDLQRFPDFERAEPIVVDLQVGEILFIPLHWWHSVWSPGFTVGITLFWPGKLRNFQFPTPGWQLLANKFLAPTAWHRGVRKLLRRQPPPSGSYLTKL